MPLFSDICDFQMSGIFFKTDILLLLLISFLESEDCYDFKLS